MNEIEVYPEDYQNNEPGTFKPYENDSLTMDVKNESMISEELIDELICNSVMDENAQALFDILDGIKKLFYFKYKEKLELILWSCSYFNFNDLGKIVAKREGV